MKSSLKKLMDLFPWFFDKSETSNFHKSQYVTNRRFQDADKDLFNIYESFHLQKRLLIWKNQVKNYFYTINFVANFPNLKTVTCYKNDDVIYTESFSYEDNVASFNYSYDGNTLNDVENPNLADIIPQHQFKIIVETWDEYSLVKGFPENDTILGDEFDHDISLDRIGEFNNIPRKEYISVEPNLYSATEPPYNDRLTEDDYHYMKRILEYNLRLHDTPAPILEIWKLYGIEATMENRERLILKVFDIYKHDHYTDTDKNAKGDKLFVGDWTPEVWEHKDKFCDYADRLGEYFFVKTSTTIPVKNQNVIFYFKFLNSLGKELMGDYTVDITLDGESIVSDYTGENYTLESKDIPQDKENYFIVTGKNGNGEIIREETITIIVRGCDSGDFYVSPNGNDKNDGKSRSKPFKTIQKAVNSVNGDKNLVILLGGDYDITKKISLKESCTIMGCGSVLVENLNDELFFNLPANKTLILQDLTLQYKGDICNVVDTTFVNSNGDGSSADVLILFTNAPVLVVTKLTIVTNKTYNIGDTIVFNGILKDRLENVLSDQTIKVTNELNNITTNYTTDENGAYTGSLVAQKLGDLTLTANYDGDNTYKGSRATTTIQVKIRLSDVLEKYDYVVMDLLYDEDSQDWMYITKPISEINYLIDMSGAVKNLKFTTGKDVKFDRYISNLERNSLTKTDLTRLRGLVVGIAYDDYNVEYTTISAFGETTLTPITLSVTEAVVGESFTFTGKLLDQYDDPLENQIVTVNGVNYTTDSNGEYTGSITPTIGSIGRLIIRANYAGDRDYEESSRSKSVPVVMNLEDVFEDYDYIVTDMVYENQDWKYLTKPVSEIESLSDLNNAIMNLNFFRDNVQFERFTSTETSTKISKTELESLNGLLVGVEYDDYKVKYTKLEVN